MIAEADSLNAGICARQRRQVELFACLEDTDVWVREGCRDLAHWLAARYQMSVWRARRMIAAGRALRSLPLLSDALGAGELPLDKTLELCRFAGPATERKLIGWAQGVTLRTVRQRADVAGRVDKQELLDADADRYLSYWYFDDGKRFGLEASLPADMGAAVAKALDRIADRAPDIVSDDDGPRTPYEDSIEVRRADALVALSSAHIASDNDPDRATVVVHADVAALCHGDRSGELEDGPALHPDVVDRLACDARLQVVLHDDDGVVVGIGRSSRTVPSWLLRQLRHRDRHCLFPGCGARRFLYAHHIHHWGHGGPTNLDNLALVCGFHHKLVHERGWKIALGPPGLARWYRPDGREHMPYAHQLGLSERAPPRELVAVG